LVSDWVSGGRICSWFGRVGDGVLDLVAFLEHVPGEVADQTVIRHKQKFHVFLFLGYQPVVKMARDIRVKPDASQAIYRAGTHTDKPFYK